MSKLIFNEEQFALLSKYEDIFIRIIRDKCLSSGPSSVACRLIHKTYSEATGDRSGFCATCKTSIARLLNDCGTLYLQDKEQREKDAAEAAAREAAAAKVEVSENQPQEIKKIKVKIVKSKKTK